MSLPDRGMQRREFKRIKRSSLAHCSVDDNQYFKGIAGILEIYETDGKWEVASPAGSAVIAAPGYKWLQLMPNGGNWWLTVMYDENDDLVQYYFDITAMNYISSSGEPRFTDMFLDIVISSDGSLAVLDEEELEAAYTSGIISASSYITAKETACTILEKVTGKENELRTFCHNMKSHVLNKATRIAGE